MASLSGACVRHAPVAQIPQKPVATAVAAVMTRQAVNAVDAGDGDYEARVLRARLDADPQDLHARLDLARHYQKAGFPDIAIEHCRLACERAPDSIEAHLALAKALRAADRATEGARVLKSFADSHTASDSVDIEAWLGVLEDEAGDWKSGEAAHRKALALEPGRDDLLNNLGYCLLEQHRTAEAAEVFRQALRLNPQSLIARNNLGLALVGDPKEAVLNWQSAADPASAHNNLAVALIEAGQYTAARKEIQAALDYDPRHAAALSNLRLVSALDGKGLDGKAVEAKPAPPSGAWSRMAAAWLHWTGSGKAEKQDNISGRAIASR